ncbi:MAG: EF-hand domain-containing protein [Hyphomicrobiaceae bacterium]
MNRKGLALSVALLATVGVASAVAAAGGHFGRGGGHGGWHEARFDGHGFGHGGRRHGKMGRIAALKQLDADKDGVVTLDEFLKPRLERFAEIDKNSDGSLDAAELSARMMQNAGQRQRMMMARLDVDGDGKVTKDEFESAAHHGRRGMHRGRDGHDGGHHRMRGGMKRQQDSNAEGGAAEDGATRKPEGDQAERGRGNRAQRSAERFARLDVNGDGVITTADLEARTSERLSWFQKKELHVLDKDGDGKVSADEFAARSKQRFADIDLDKDGRITAADLPPGMAERWNKKSAPADK